MSDRILNFLKTDWWDLVPFVGFVAIAVTEGKLYWLGGILAIVWLFTECIRVFTK